MLWLALLTTGCNTVGFYKQAVAGQYEIISRQQKISELLVRTNTPADLRGKLELVLRLREFAEHELHLRTDGHYAKYADLGRPFVVWNVYAAPEFSMEPKQWWYPVVGRLKYRGFFAEADARACADRLVQEGYDIYVGGAEAYSTLGFFKDPVLNTFIHHPPADLAETLFHELAHQRWLAQQGDTIMRAEYENDLRRQRQFVALVLRARDELKQVYDGKMTEDAKRAARGQVIARLHADYGQLKAGWNGYSGYDNWFERPINNARLNTVATYYTLVPAFQHLLAKHGGDLSAFYAEAKAVATSPKKERHERLVALAGATPSVAAASAKPAR